MIAAQFVVYFQLLTGVSLTQNSDCWGTACVMVHLLTGHQIWYNHRHDTRESLWDKVKLVMRGQTSAANNQYKKISHFGWIIYKVLHFHILAITMILFFNGKIFGYCGKSEVCLSMMLKKRAVLYFVNDCLISGEIRVLSI